MRHVCGTCRSFQAAPHSKRAGWCGHPLKQTTKDVRILVREGELNCRDDWDHDLWQSREDNDRVLDVTMLRADADGKRPVDSPQVEPVRVLGDHADRPQGHPFAPKEMVAEQESETPRLTSSSLERGLVRTAHNQYRARQRSVRPDGPRPLGATEPERVDDRPEALIISNDVLPFKIGGEAPVDRAVRVDPNDRDVTGVVKTAVSPPGAFSSVPTVDGVTELPRQSPRRTGPPPPVDDYAFPSPRSYDGAVGSHQPPSVEHTPPSTPVTTGDDRPGNIAARHPGRRIDAPVDRGAPRAGRDQGSAEGPVRDIEAEPMDRTPRGASTVEAEHTRPVDADQLPPWDYREARRPRGGAFEAHEVTRAPATSSSRLWDDIARCCRTCRDFRPADTGGRGWCTNQWAFRHKRMVDVDDLPCETTIGAWWLPTDEAWRDDLDVGRHTLATPLMDRWVGRGNEVSEGEYPVVARRTRRH